MNNPLTTLLGKSFTIKTRNIGSQIESILGSEVNKRAEADFGFWECKSKKIDGKSQVTLGGKSTEDMSVLLEAVYYKVDNLIFCEYTINEDKTFTIIKISILFDMNKDTFFNSIGNGCNVENHHKSTNIRARRKNFIKLYGKNIIEYTA